ncbi:NADH-quinone oxidoreductase subunit J [Legionella pneumophila]|uniref:NADH-quinone oxidoreductase subunit J n=1 Tax=Legionella pneumophila (strain Lens) TaxID=297245 RepID=Q5WT29_LEGPL|nr:NADH-quinone oxidoreductase subunit J [Legionella pneumophila]AOW53473.1 NADH:ubiquinone oxidoreductase subunit J [Legionella pneumophila subsp. pneumophila]AOW55630.1 NADH:ubiquinone oxidoreductase subunit J [Legionella pneumophila subsp. pneumophila]AOW64272.1 NADH:ubiquinone oxidoreductase subunit J [Legionella pneumophila subsp. pneumophila]RYW83140.1 NADH-quinone oxidoreductase subunit J [Legionella pneumophila]RYW87274.1 NADH-quinone oxidoreductase subunit J [Legionella pneumophila]
MHEWVIQAIFYVFALLTVLSAVMVISQNNPVRCVLFLVLTFFTSAVLWILAEAEFLALILILVYVGAVMTLFLFVVMMLNIDIESMKSHLIKYLPFGLIIVALFTGLLMVAIPKDLFKNSVQTQEKPLSVNSQLMDLSTEDGLVTPENATSNTEKLGMVLYTDYILAFEIAAVILLVAIVSAITLVHRGAIRSKRQDITQQIMTRRAERVKLISMKSEK